MGLCCPTQTAQGSGETSELPKHLLKHRLPAGGELPLAPNLSLYLSHRFCQVNLLFAIIHC